MVIRQNSRAVEVIENVHDTSSVPVISYSTSVVDVTCCVLQYLWRERHEYMNMYVCITILSDLVALHYLSLPGFVPSLQSCLGGLVGAM